MTRMRRIGFHGNNLDAVERLNGLSRTLCSRAPDPREGQIWLQAVKRSSQVYSLPIFLLGAFLGAGGFSLFFGGGWIDGLAGGLCGILVGLVNRFMDKLKANPFFSTIAASFLMSLVAYTLGAAGLTPSPDAVIIGALMILVPGLLFTNAMRDIIYGDTNSGINRCVQVIIIAMGSALGTASAWKLASFLWATPVSVSGIPYSFTMQCIFAFLGCLGFVIVFNIHGKGCPLCALGGALTWAVYLLSLEQSGSELTAYFWSALFSSLYSETMARIRKVPALTYLVIAIFPIIPGAGAYYTMNYAVRGEMELFASRGMFTAAIAGVMAVGILLGSTLFRMYSDRKTHRK